MSEPAPKKSLGQHWLEDAASLESICSAAEITPSDTILEIGPGLGSLTALLAARAAKVIAVELDETLARELPTRVRASNLSVVRQDVLKFDLTTLPPNYKVVANIPYYLTGNLLRLLSETTNQASRAVLLVQKEVALRAAAEPGDLSLLGVMAQYYWEVSLGVEIPAQAFTPPPKVDSQVLILHRRGELLFKDVTDVPVFFRLVKAGFGERRKKLRSSLSGGLHIDKSAADELLSAAGINPDRRAQTISLDEWHALYLVYARG